MKEFIPPSKEASSLSGLVFIYFLNGGDNEAAWKVLSPCCDECSSPGVKCTEQRRFDGREAEGSEPRPCVSKMSDLVAVCSLYLRCHQRYCAGVS